MGRNVMHGSNVRVAQVPRMQFDDLTFDVQLFDQFDLCVDCIQFSAIIRESYIL
jgi:hypothetical protein